MTKQPAITRDLFTGDWVTVPDPLPTEPAGIPDAIVPDRPHREHRAGTHLDHRFTQPIYGTAHTQRQHGLYDSRQRVFQCGGEYANFVYQKLQLLTLDIAVYQQARDLGAEWYEWVDHSLNQCWRISRTVADAYGQTYANKIGQRWGVPLATARRYNNNDEEIR